MSNENANVILQQLGNGRFIAMTGAKNFVAHNFGLQFDLPKYPGVKINRVYIFLNDKDLYDVEFGRMSKKKDPEYGVMMPNYEKISVEQDVYVDQLRAVFTTATGLATSI